MKPIKAFLDLVVPSQYAVPEKVITTRYKVFDVTAPDMYKSMCFTKAYTQYIEGTGSIYSPCKDGIVDEIFGLLMCYANDGCKNVNVYEHLQHLALRFFTPNEVARLMNFPPELSFPEDVTDKQRYRLLGNSINVAVVAEVMKLLFD